MNDALSRQLICGASVLLSMREANAQGQGATAPAPPQGIWVRVEDLPAREAPSAVYLELGGSAVAYSINYEHRFVPELGLRAGAGVFPLCVFHCETVVVLPLSIQAIVGEGNHHFEVGGGVTITTLRDKDARFAIPEIGYRYEKPDGGFLFRALFTPLFRLNDLKDVTPWAGLSFGYAW